MNYGLIEGFYGPPWPWQRRRSLAPFLAERGYAFYIYAPKNDRFLRQDWRQDWPAAEFRQLSHTARNCRAAGLAFGVGLSPYQAWEEDETTLGPALEAKARSLVDLGLDILALLFDDMRGNTDHLAARQATIAARLAGAVAPARVILCPTYYSDDPLLDEVFGRRPDGYLEELGDLLDKTIDIFWTGPSVISGQYPAGHLEEVAHRIGRRPFIWDNYPVNDMARADFLHLAAFRRAPGELSQLTAGHAVNPMLQSELSRIPLATLADCYRQGDAYRPLRSFHSALEGLCSPELAARLATDAAVFQDQGRTAIEAAERERLAGAYAALPDAMAKEVAAWLAATDTRRV